MRRVIAAFAALVICLFCAVCSAKEIGFSCEYTPKSEKSSVFYIDVICEREVSAAVFSLDYDEKFVSFRSVDATESTTTVRGNDAGGRVTVALADSGSVKGKLCRLSFQALSQGETSFVLKVSQAADDSMDKVETSEDYTLTVTFDKDDVVSSSSKGSKSSSGSSSKSSSSSKGRSGGSSIWDNGDDPSGGDYYDLRPDNTWIYILIGAGSMLLIAAAVGVTIYVMKKKKLQPEQSADPAEPKPDDEEPDEDKQKMIEELNDEVLGDTEQDE